MTKTKISQNWGPVDCPYREGKSTHKNVARQVQHTANNPSLSALFRLKMKATCNILGCYPLEFVKSRQSFCTIWYSRILKRILQRNNKKCKIMELNDRQIEKLADKVAEKIFHMLQTSGTGNNKQVSPNMCTVKEAAKILGICEDHMRRIKDRFPHVKQGDNQQGRILFERDALIKCYVDV